MAEETKIKESPELLKTMFENAPDAYFLSDVKGTFLDGNKVAEDLIGYKKEELIGKNMLRAGLVPKDQIPKVMQRLSQHAAGKTTEGGVVEVLTKEGKRVPLEVTGKITRHKGKILVLGIARDVSEQRKREEELKRANEELKKMNQLMVGRENKMVELKGRIKELEEEIKRLKEKK